MVSPVFARTSDRLFEYINIRNTGHVAKRDFVRLLVLPELPLRRQDRLPDGTYPVAAVDKGVVDAATTRKAMYQVCDALEVAKMSPEAVRVAPALGRGEGPLPTTHMFVLVPVFVSDPTLQCCFACARVVVVQAFEAFDTNASGSISTSEFMSLMRTLGGRDFPRQHLIHLMASMDSDVDRSISKREFATLLGVCWAQRFLELESDERLGRTVQGSGARAVTARRQASSRVRSLERMLIRYFGPDFRDNAFLSDLPGPFENLLRSFQSPQFADDPDGAGYAGGIAAATSTIAAGVLKADQMRTARLTGQLAGARR